MRLNLSSQAFESRVTVSAIMADEERPAISTAGEFQVVSAALVL
jgi:hypothetical protein